MFKPEALLFSKDHEWINTKGKELTVGISDFAQNNLGEVIYVDLPTVGQKVDQHTIVGSIESIKAVSDIYSPVSGEITSINDELSSKPELINNEPLGGGWLFKIKISDSAQLKNLLRYDDYLKFTED